VTVVLVSGAAGVVGRHTIARLAERDDVERVIAFDRRRVPVDHRKVVTQVVDLGDPAQLPEVRRADVLVHLAFASANQRRRSATEVNLGGTSRLLSLADAVGVDHVVNVSSATVYGAWPNNPLPITEEMALRPVPQLTYAVHKAQVEQLVGDWVDAEAERSAAVLRPCTSLAEYGSSWLSRALAAGLGVLAPEEDPPAQFLHIDDLLSAVELAVVARLDGPFNVAPDGWIDGATVRDLAGRTATVRAPAWLLHWVSRVRWRLQRGPIPPGLLPYLSHPWLVANDRLRAAGWAPTITNEQAYVAGTEARWWQVMTPQRRQELALGGTALAGLGVIVATAAGARAALRHRRSDPA
jgi:nucleoside-diphosphate-sugar epimerase